MIVLWQKVIGSWKELQSWAIHPAHHSPYYDLAILDFNSVQFQLSHHPKIHNANQYTNKQQNQHNNQ